MGLRVFIAGGTAALFLAGAALASHLPRQPAQDWAAGEIQAVAAADVMGTKSAATFHPAARLTRQALANLGYNLKLRLLPPPLPATPPTTTTATTTTQTTTDPTQTSTDPTATTDTSTDPATTTTDTTATTTTTTISTTTTMPAPTPPPPPPPPPKVANPNGAVSMAGLDAGLVSALGLGKAAAEFAAGARAAGLQVPGRFGTEVVARLLGLRLDHPAAQDYLELLPNDPATRAEAAYSAAQILRFSDWQVAGIQSLADSFALPHLSMWKKRILDTAVARIGMPYVWGGTSDTYEVEFGVPSRGGYDCSGFVWRVYKLQPYPGERDLASALRGRTTYVMSGEVPHYDLIKFKNLQPADVIFFGARGPRSSPSQVDHMGIYIGNGWFIHSSEYGVALATMDGWYRHEFAWGRRPLREAGLER